MQGNKRRKLEKDGWEMGDADKFLALRPEESDYIERKLAFQAEHPALVNDSVASVDDPVDEGVEEAWEREIRRRIQRIDSADAELLEAEDVLPRIKDRIKD